MAAKKKTADEKTKPGSPSTIRDEAEKKLKESPALPSELTGQDPEQLIHELRVHQIELNMQAEELRRSHIELENSRDKFLDQYDFAPTGLLTINEKGSIVEVNLTCSTLLGAERSTIVRARFSKFVVPEDQDQWYWYISNVLQQEGKQYCTLMLKRTGGSSFPARLEGVRLSGGINPEIRIAISDITEIWQAEDQLKKSEEQYRLLTDNAVSAVAVHEIVLDRKGKPVDSVFRSANPAFKIHTGLRAEDVIGHRITELMPGIEKTPFIGICGKVVLTGEAATFEQYSETLSRHFYVNAFKVGKGRFATVFIDITDRKRTEEALRLTQLRLDSAMQAGNIAWWEMDWKTGNVIFDERKAQMLGYPVEQFSHYSDFTQLVHPDDYQPIMQAMRDLISGINKQYDVDYRIRTHNGEYLWFHDIGAISDYASDGSPSKVTGLVIDITGRKQAEEKLKQSGSLLRSMIESPQSIIIFSLDLNLRYLAFNSSHQQTIKAIWGVDIRPGMSMLAVISIEIDRKKAERNFKRALSGEHFILTEEYGDSALSRKFYENTYSPIYDENHNVTGLTVYVIDVTERKKAEVALRESDERYRTLFDKNSDLIFVADPKTRMITDCNRKAEQLTGYSRSELLGLQVDALHPEDVRSETLDNFMNISEGMNSSVDSILTTRDGRRVPVLITGGPVVVNGQTLLLGSFRDMTRQKQAEEALQNAHDTLEIQVKKRTADLYLANMQLQKEIEERKVIAESLKEYAKMTSILNEVILTANKTESLPELFKDTLDKALELLDFEAGGIYLVNPAERTAEIHYTKNLPDDFVEKLRTVRIDAPPYYTLFIKNQPIISDHYEEMSPELAQKYHISSMASIPLVSKNKVIGALNVASSKRYTISADEKQVLITIGRELGTIVERLIAEEAFKKASENLQVLFDSVNEMIFVLDMQGRIFKVNKTVERKLGYTDEELHNTDVLLLHVPDRRDEALINVQGMIACTIDSCPVPLLSKNKEIIEVETKVTRGWWDGNEVLIGVSRDVTERNLAENEIKQQASLIKSLLDSIPDIIFFKDKEGVYLGCNPPFAELVGKPREDIIGKTDYDLFDKEIADFFRGYDNRMLELGKPSQNEEQITYPDGRKKQIDTLKTPYWGPDGNLIGVLGISRDITERKAAEEALHQLSNRLSLAVKAGGVGIWDWDLVNNTLTWDDQMFALYGITREQFSGAYDAWQAGLYPDDRARGDAEIQQALSGEKEFDTEFRVLWPDGTIRNIRALAVVHRDAKGKPLRLIGTNWDITGQKMAEEAFRKSEEQIRLLLDSTAEAIYGIDIKGNCTFCNNSCLSMLKYLHPDELLGKNMHWQIHHTYPDGTYFPVEKCRIFQAFTKGEKTHVDDEVLWRSDGTSFPAEYWSYPQRLDGEIVGAVVTFLDITARKRSEKALQENDILLRLILSLSARFINISSDKIYSEISTAIGELGRFAGVDRSYVFLLSDDGMSMHNTHEWCAEGIVPQKDTLQDLSTELFPWWMERLHRFETIHVPRVAELPGEAGSEKEILEAQDIKSVLIVPLISQNTLIGFLGFDSVRHEKTWPENIITLVTITGKSISNAIEREHAEEALRKSEFFLKETQQIARLGGWKANPQTDYLEWTDEVYDIIEAPHDYRPGLLEGMKYYAPEDIPVLREKITACLLTGEPFNIEVRLTTETGKKVSAEVRGLAPVIEGARSYVIGTLQDITERKHLAEEIAASLLEKETLLKEIHHRVKNNMQVISSLLLLQRKQISDPKTRALFQESENRIFSIALVHEKLYRSKSLSNVDVQDYLRMMGDYLFTSFDIAPGRIALDIKAEGIFLSIDKAIPLSLITNELLTNSLKHAFPDQRKGSIRISMTHEKRNYRYIFHDDGIGFPEHVDFKNTESLGMQLVNGLVGQILGKITLTREKGTTFEIVFTIVNDTEDYHEQGNHTYC
jgi:PAS domain S-box-containing protein